jgi:hypothetical protein
VGKERNPFGKTEAKEKRSLPWIVSSRFYDLVVFK